MRLAVLMSLGSPWSRDAAARLAACGHEVYAIDFSNTRSDSYLNATDAFQAAEIREFVGSIAGAYWLTSRFSSHLRYFSGARKLRKTLRELRADLLLTLYGGGFSTMARVSGFRPYAVYAVGSDVLLGGTLKRISSRVAFTKASEVFVNGQHLVETTRSIAPRANLFPLHLGTDVNRFSPGSPSPEPVRVVCTRGFAEIYNNEFLVRALAKMPALGVAYETIFAAPGPLLDRVRGIADQVLTPERRKWIQFLGGISKNDLAAVLKSSHVYVSVSRSDGTSSSLMEGLACGLFPVLSDIPANREWIFPEAQNGLLVPLGDTSALAGALARAIKDTQLRSNASRFNRKLILDFAADRKNIRILSNELECLVRGVARNSPQLARIPE